MTIMKRRNETTASGERVFLDRGGRPIDTSGYVARMNALSAPSRRDQALLAGAGFEAPERQWFVLRVRTGSDFVIDGELDRLGVEHWTPAEQREVPFRGGRKWQKGMTQTRPFFPGYLFVHVHSQPHAWAVLARVKGVISVLGISERPMPVRDSEIARLRTYVSTAKERADAVKAANLPAIGEMVQVTEGPFASFPGTIAAVDGDKHRALVEVFIFGRAVPVDLDLAQLARG